MFQRYDMAELLMRMGQPDRAERMVQQGLEHEANSSDVTSLIMQASFYNLLAKIYERWDGKYNEAAQSLMQAKSLQAQLLRVAQVRKCKY